MANTKKIEENTEDLKIEDIKDFKITKPKKVIVKSEPIKLKKTVKKESKKETKTWVKKKAPAKKTSAKK